MSSSPRSTSPTGVPVALGDSSTNTSHSAPSHPGPSAAPHATRDPFSDAGFFGDAELAAMKNCELADISAASTPFLRRVVAWVFGYLEHPDVPVEAFRYARTVCPDFLSAVFTAVRDAHVAAEARSAAPSPRGFPIADFPALDDVLTVWFDEFSHIVSPARVKSIDDHIPRGPTTPADLFRAFNLNGDHTHLGGTGPNSVRMPSSGAFFPAIPQTSPSGAPISSGLDRLSFDFDSPAPTSETCSAYKASLRAHKRYMASTFPSALKPLAEIIMSPIPGPLARQDAAIVEAIETELAKFARLRECITMTPPPVRRLLAELDARDPEEDRHLPSPAAAWASVLQGRDAVATADAFSDGTVPIGVYRELLRAAALGPQVAIRDLVLSRRRNVFVHLGLSATADALPRDSSLVFDCFSPAELARIERAFEARRQSDTLAAAFKKSASAISSSAARSFRDAARGGGASPQSDSFPADGARRPGQRTPGQHPRGRSPKSPSSRDDSPGSRATAAPGTRPTSLSSTEDAAAPEHLAKERNGAPPPGGARNGHRRASPAARNPRGSRPKSATRVPGSRDN